jgi:hypothetical protein
MGTYKSVVTMTLVTVRIRRLTSRISCLDVRNARSFFPLCFHVDYQSIQRHVENSLLLHTHYRGLVHRQGTFVLVCRDPLWSGGSRSKSYTVVSCSQWHTHWSPIASWVPLFTCLRVLSGRSCGYAVVVKGHQT